MKTKFNGFLTLLLAFLVQITFAQEKTVTGKISDMNGPLPGVTVVVKGTSTGTQSDFDGNYSIRAAAGDVLQYSFIGMKPLEKTVGSSNTLDAVMQESAQALEEVVVTALGIKREKKSLGYSQQSVSGEELTKSKETDISNALAGKVSGVQIVGQSSTTFDNSSIRLRGSDDVLYVVDGIKVYSTSDINTNNIADISVLKGASATAIYGPEGRNGVVVITSKVAESGKATFEIDQSTTFNFVSTLPDYQNEYGGGYSQEFNVFNYDPAQDDPSWASFDGQLYPDFWADESWGPKLDGTPVRQWDSWIPGGAEFGKLRAWSPSPNDVKSFYDTGVSSNTNFSFSKAGEDYNIRTSVTRLTEEGIVPNSKLSSSKISVNASYDISERFKFFTNINYEDREILNNPTQGYANLASNFNQWWQRQLDFDRLQNYEQNGQIVSWNIRGPRDSRPLYWDMPYFHSYENLQHNYKNTTYGKVGGTYDITDNLSVTGEIRKTFNSYLNDDRGTTKSSLDPAYYNESQVRNEKDEYFGIINYDDKYLDGDLDMALSIGGEVVDNEYKSLSASTNGDLTIPGFYNLSGTKDPVSASNGKALVSTKGVFTKGSFGYKGMLYLDGSYRMDWSSTAKADDNRIDTYGGSLSFLVSKVLPQNDVLTFAKVRAGYANAPFFPNPYAVSSTYNVGGLYQGNGTLSISGSQENPNLVGGTRGELEIGTEMQFFNNRISLDFTYFNRVDEDIPVTVPLDGSTGYSSIVLNSGKQTSSGLELGVFGDIIDTEDFSWGLGVNFATLEKFVDELYPGIDSRDISDYTSNMKLQERVGEEWGLFYGNTYATDANGSVLFRSTGGGNYAYSRLANQKLGSLLPDFTGGLYTNLRYKNLELDLGFDFQKGGMYYSRTERYYNHSGLSAITAGLNDKGNPKRDPVSAGGGHHIVGVLQTGTNADGDPISDGTVVDAYVDPQDLFNLGNIGNVYSENLHSASYFKLRSVKLNYTFDSDVVESLGLSGASIGVFANNVWLIYAEVPWIDPSEIEKRSGYNWAEAGQLPMTTSAGFNLKLTF